MEVFRLTKKADADLAGLYRYGIKNFGTERADLYFNSLYARLREIGNDPIRFPITEYKKGYRRSVHAPHTIYYRIIDPNMVEIVRILRGQDPRQSF